MTRPSWIDNPALTFLCRLAGAVIFLWAGLAKLGDPAGFATQASRYELMPQFANLIGITFPWIEVLLGATLLAGIWPRASALATCLLLGLFLIGLTWALAHGLKVDCGCFGSNEPLTIWTIVRDGLFLLPSIQATISRGHRAVLLEG